MKRIRSKWQAAMIAGPLSLLAAGLCFTAAPATESTTATKSATAKTQTVVRPETLKIANALSEAFRNVASGVLPAVVAIENRPLETRQAMEAKPPLRRDRFEGSNPFKGTPFEDMFDERLPKQPRMQPRSTPRSQGGIGSGVIIDAAGVVLTNNHVVAGGGKVIIRTQDGREFVATEVLTDPQTDIAVLKFSGDGNLVAAPLGDSDQTQVGDWVVALGQPFGLESTVTAGIVSAKDRGIGITARENFIQTDAAINPGNSGGPLVNLRGEVVGINTAISSRGGGNNGVGFAVPSNLASWVSAQLVKTGSVQRSYLGVGIQPVSYELATQLGVSPRGGVAVTNVFPDTPAAKTGLKTGDVITHFGNRPVATPQQLQLAVERSAEGTKVPVKIVREGEAMELTYDPALQPSDFGSVAARESEPEPEAAKLQSLGIAVQPLDGELAEQLGLEAEEGILVSSVGAQSPADRAGLKPGMVITEVNRQGVATVAEFKAAVKADPDGSILLLVRTTEGSQFVVVSR